MSAPKPTCVFGCRDDCHESVTCRGTTGLGQLHVGKEPAGLLLTGSTTSPSPSKGRGKVLSQAPGRKERRQSQREAVVSIWEKHTEETLPAPGPRDHPGGRTRGRHSFIIGWAQMGVHGQRRSQRASPGEGQRVLLAPSGLWHHRATDELWLIVCFFPSSHTCNIMCANLNNSRRR